MMSPAYKLISLTKKYGSNFVANILQQGIRFLILYVAAKQLGPNEFGIASIILLISNYLMNSNLGAVNGLKRQIPLVYAGKGGRFTLNAFFSVLNFNLVATIVAAIVAAFILYYNYEYGLIASMLLVILALSINVYFSIQAYFTSTGNWKNLFRLQSICALLLIVALSSLLLSSYPVLLAVYAASFLFASLFFFYENGYRPNFDKIIIKENVTVGFPVMVSGFIYLLFQTTDRLIVSHYYSSADFGYYSFAWLLAMSLNLLISLSSEMILQRAASRFAQVSDKKYLLRFILKYSGLVQAALIVISFGLVMAAQYIIPVYLGEYQAAIPAIRNIIIAYVIQQLGLAAANYYYIVGRQAIYNLMLIISCLINLAILLYPVLFGSDLPTIETISGLYIWSSCIYVVLLYLPMIKNLTR